MEPTITAKKQWITPKVEVISKNIIQIGTTPGGIEGSPTPGLFGTYSGS